MEMVSDQTLTKCHHCGKWTNYAGDAHYKARMAEIARLTDALEHISQHFGSAEMCRELAADALKRTFAATVDTAAASGPQG